MADVAENWEHEKLDVYTKSIRYVRSHEIIKKKTLEFQQPKLGMCKIEQRINEIYIFGYGSKLWYHV
jgi:hypothetical protein